ncbi:MAG TPA: Fe-S cluster assembly protein SufD [Acidimicrobiales bacterium]|nr:Fe-S cluster assembly protein SufD [Acidimicrobiales bacterium]
MPTLTHFGADQAARPPDAERFAAAALPTEEEEVWRYSRIDDLDLDRYRPATGSGGAAGSPVADILRTVGARSGTIVMTNGGVAESHLDEGLAAKGVRLEIADPAGADWAPPEVDDAFVTLNAAFAAQPVLLDVPAGVVVEQPIVVATWIDGDGTIVFPRLVVRAGEQSQVTVLEYAASADIDALVIPVTELHVAPAANVRHVSVQDLGRRMWQLGYVTSRVERDGFLESAAVALGGDYARLRTDARVVGQGASSNLLAVYFGTGTQMHDFRTLQDHNAPRTTSDLLFKGAVGDESSSVYTGLIRVRPGASGTNAFQTNRNLVLSQGAHAESVPNLEIEENDVRCSHASAIGPVDEEQRYYLESRGIPTDVAERLIVLGFFDEIIDRTAIAALRPLLRDAVVTKLESAKR